MSSPDAAHAPGARVGNDGAALRDAESIAARIASDEAAADEARRVYQADGLPAMAADGTVAAILRPGETLHAVHASALLETAGLGAGDALPRGGTLYITSRRLLHSGVELTERPLAEVDEMAVALERLLLIRLRDGSDLAIEVDRPRLLRVQLSAAIAALRAGETSQP
jgi:hypothetical protein